ncbi:MAG: leucyl aminopeptidase [Rhodospirillaceae bacterium]|nr:leucyl aminopeptidase [Rhodospirillaceae bacterium]|tara:strand:+ start:229 stop:1611 length:1383 start_codon:yes stop_codon:yes gene_type:complete
MPFVSRKNTNSVPITPVTVNTLHTQKHLRDKLSQTWLRQTGFTGKPGTFCFLPTPKDRSMEIILGVEENEEIGGGIWDLAGLPQKLPKGRYYLNKQLSPAAATRATTGWALGEYQFNKYTKTRQFLAEFVWPERVNKSEVTRLAVGIGLTRDLINTPANDLGPRELGQTARKLAKLHKAKITVISGLDLLRHNYPSVHAVGRASSRSPCLIDMRWGKISDPKVTLVGKGVCFDSGGLDIKPASGMFNMKKDMGGAAQVLGLAHIIMDANLPIRLRVLIPAVENSISGNAFRPRDVLRTRKGLTVEVGNTDAEGRLILSDALTEASSENPEMVIDFATLTGAARIAVGTDLPAMFCNDEALAGALSKFGLETNDPLCRLPLWPGYKSLLDSKIADLSSTGATPYGGAITAALFLEHFIAPNTPWAHIDLMAYNTTSRPGRPEGGEAQGIRAIYAMLKGQYA